VGGAGSSPAEPNPTISSGTQEPWPTTYQTRDLVTRQTGEKDPVLQSVFRRLFRQNQRHFSVDLLRKITKV